MREIKGKKGRSDENVLPICISVLKIIYCILYNIYFKAELEVFKL